MSRPPTILVTGGASGIGLAIAKALLEEGWRVVVADLDEASLDRCRGALGRSDGRVRFERMNVADEEAVVDAISACEAEFGPLTGLVNSAGIGRDVPALATSADLDETVAQVEA